MLNKKLKRGFTLIELLVVITIIGILATGAVAVYTAQIQKARDSTRINDIKAIQSGVEQVYQDSWEYPHSDAFTGWTWSVTWVANYVELIPSDAKFGQPCNGGDLCWYIYASSVDENSILYWEYELSTAFENEWNRTNKAETDHWNDNNRFEIWIQVWTIRHNTSSASSTATKSNITWCRLVTDGTSVPATGTAAIFLWDDCTN